MISIKRYNESNKREWNHFNHKSKNGLFMFDRDYMDYHKDRFTDHSLFFYKENDIIAILPMTEHGRMLISHGGLTYGGFITDSKMKQHTMNECFDALIAYARQLEFESIRYKVIPHIYHNQPAEEDRFALFLNNATLTTVDVSTYLNMNNPLKMPKGRKAQITRARREGIIVNKLIERNDYDAFIDLENYVLQERHKTRAVHSGKELKMLHDRFPNNIHLFVAQKEGEMIAGTVIYEYADVIHTQYMAANNEARVIGALDLTIATIIDLYRNSKLWLDFGISTERGRVYLNTGLVSQKEGFGGRTGVYETWEIKL